VVGPIVCRQTPEDFMNLDINTSINEMQDLLKEFFLSNCKNELSSSLPQNQATSQKKETNEIKDKNNGSQKRQETPPPSLSSFYNTPSNTIHIHRNLQQQHQLQQQTPYHHQHRDNSRDGNSLSIFDATCEYIITGSELAGKLLCLNISDIQIISRPTEIINDRYERNSLRFSVGFVLRSRCDARPYKPVLTKLAEILRVMEMESSYLSNLQHHNIQKPFHMSNNSRYSNRSNSHPPPPPYSKSNNNDNYRKNQSIHTTFRSMELQQVLSTILIQLNSTRAECNLFLDEANALNIKLYNPPNPPAFPLEDYIVPVLLRPEWQLQLFDWDLTVNWIVPHIDGDLHIKQIAQNPDVDMDMEMVRACLRVLKQYEVVDFVDIFQYSNLYECTSEALDILSNTYLSSSSIPTSTSSSLSVSSDALSHYKNAQLLNEAFEFVCKVAKKDDLLAASANIPASDTNFSRSSSTAATAPNQGASYSLPKDYYMNIAISRNSSSSPSASLSSSAGTGNIRSPTTSTLQHPSIVHPHPSHQSPYIHQPLHHSSTSAIPSSLSGRVVVPSSYPPIKKSMPKQTTQFTYNSSSTNQSHSQSHSQDNGAFMPNNAHSNIHTTVAGPTPMSKSFTNIKEKRKIEEYRLLKAALAQLYCVCHRNTSFGDIILSKMSMGKKNNDENVVHDDDNHESERHEEKINSNIGTDDHQLHSILKKTGQPENDKPKLHGNDYDQEFKSNSASSSNHNQAPSSSAQKRLFRQSSKEAKTALEPILTAEEWCQALAVFDHRRFITFGIIHGWIRRIHCFPFAYNIYTTTISRNTTESSDNHVYDNKLNKAEMSGYDPFLESKTSKQLSLLTSSLQAMNAPKREDLKNIRNKTSDVNPLISTKEKETPMISPGSSAPFEDPDRKLAYKIAEAMDGTKCDDELSCIFGMNMQQLVNIVKRAGTKDVAMIYSSIDRQ